MKASSTSRLTMPVSPISPAGAGTSSPPKLSVGDKGPAVARLQQQLKGAGFNPGAVDGEFGPATRAAVVAFQKDRGLVADGVVGPATHGALGRPAGGAAPSAPTQPGRTNTPAPAAPSRAATGTTPTVPAAGPERTGAPGAASPTGVRGWLSDLNVSEFLGTTVAGASPLSRAGVSPAQVLGGVRSGDLSISVPMKAGELASLDVSPGTSARMALSVKDGTIDFAKSRMVFEPPLKGPLGARISDVQMRPDGRAEVDIPGLPNAIIGNPAPAKLSSFVESLQNAQSIPVKVLGITVGDLRGGGGASGESPVDLGSARVTAKNVTFQDGAVPLGNAGRVRFGADSKLELSGSLRDLSLKGRVSVADMDLSAGGTKLKGAHGTADFDARWIAHGPAGANGLPASGTLAAKLTNLSLGAESAVSRRPNGDFIELARGEVSGGSITIAQAIKNGAPAGPAEADLRFNQFEGTVTRAQLTVPDGTGTAQLALRDSKLKGSVAINNDQVHFAGEVALDGTLSDFDSKPTASGRSTHVDSAAVKGQAHVDFNTLSGMKLAGRAAVNVEATGVDIGQRGVSIQDASATVSGTADVALDERGLSLGNGDLRLSASAKDGKVSLGDSLSLDLKAGTRVDAALRQVVFGHRSVAMDLGQTQLDAQLDGGKLKLPGGAPLELKDGARISFTFDRLSVPAQGIPSASGKMSLVASLGANEVDRASLARIPGLNLSSVSGVNQQLRVNLGRFSIANDGRYEVQDLSLGVEATVDRLTGVIR